MASLPDLDLCHSYDLFFIVFFLVFLLLFGGRLLFTPRVRARDAATLESLDAFVQKAVAYSNSHMPSLVHQQPDA
jgi:hypothetical protein